MPAGLGVNTAPRHVALLSGIPHRHHRLPSPSLLTRDLALTCVLTQALSLKSLALQQDLCLLCFDDPLLLGETLH